MIPFVLLLLWLCLTYGLSFALGAAFLERGPAALAWAFLVAIPVIRLCLRFRRRKGYYLPGYLGDVGGDFWSRGRWMSRHDSPRRFRLLLLSELSVISLLSLSILFRDP